MISADQFHKCDVRMRQAMRNEVARFGGLAVNICGDFLQLPPVNKDGSRKSLAIAFDDVGNTKSEDAHADDPVTKDDKKTKRNNEAILSESRQGFELWRSIYRIVCLEINVRAPGLLSRIQAEMREGQISDKMWDVYMSRVLQDNDERLTNPNLPFLNGDVRFIVHRHKIRLMRSLQHAKDICRKTCTPLYVVQARDDAVHPCDASKLTTSVQTQLLELANPEQTKGLQGFLPLYRGMKLLLSSKDCVKLGIVKGCPCTFEDIVFADEEVLPYPHVAGHAHQLKYMPVSLLLRVENPAWALAQEDLPKTLPKRIDRRGLFQLRPSYDYLSVLLQTGEYLKVRRTSFLVTPADTITVYAAQGSTYDAVIADMANPGNLKPEHHWLACYVMLSRAKSLDGFLVLRPARRSDLNARPPKHLLDEMDRLLNLEQKSHKELVDYIGTLKKFMDISGFVDILAEDAPAKEKAKVRQIRASTSCKSSEPQNLIVAPGVSKRSPAQMNPCTMELRPRKRLRKKTTLEAEEREAMRESTDKLHFPVATAALGVIGASMLLSKKLCEAHNDSKSDGTVKHQHEGGQPSNELSYMDVDAATSAAPISAAASSSAPISPVMHSCTRSNHTCHFDANSGCASCHRTCHKTCQDPLCELEACGFCYSVDVVTHVDSTLCIECQKHNIGCHECGRYGCFSSAMSCYAKCKPRHHVCGPSSTRDGCTSCGRLCHETNDDVRCEYYQRHRGDVTWETDERQRLDTLAGTEGNVPHLSQIAWSFAGRAPNGSRRILVDNTAYIVGRGDPGRAEDGEYNNCLIDSLRQCLQIESDRRAVRDDLRRGFAQANGRAKVTATSYLDVDSHWQAILHSLFRHNRSGHQHVCDILDYCVVALAAERAGHGVVLGNINALHRLVALNDRDVHFDPCLPL